jgi:hypothetical protein
MGLEQATLREVVDKAVDHRWGIPEFQRGFVWTPQKVRDLIDSLWRGYPVGSFLIWYGGDYGEPRAAGDARAPDAWVVDGQQRTTALCALFGRKPYWWIEGWNETLKRHDVRFNVVADEDPYFSLHSAAMRGPAGRSWVPVREILNSDDDALAKIVQELLHALQLPGGRFGALWTRLDGVRRVRDLPIPIVAVTLDLEDVTEIFARLNSAGTKVTEADIALALAASQNPGWARGQFLPFLRDLTDAGFELDPNLVFRSCVGIGLGRARLKDVPKGYWKSEGLLEAWKRTDSAWRKIIHYVEESGILSAEILPTKNALIPLAILTNRFEDVLSTKGAVRWLLHATRAGRYSGSALTALESDVQAIGAAPNAAAALEVLHGKLPAWEPFTAEDFLQDYRDRFIRLLLYLVMYDRGARDWVSKQRLGFHGGELLEQFNPDWHHIFPRAYLKREGVVEDRWNLFANIAVISPSSNIRFGGQNPMTYLDRYKVDDAALEEQLVYGGRRLLKINRYEEFVAGRADALANAVNAYFSKLASQPVRGSVASASRRLRPNGSREASPPTDESVTAPDWTGEFATRWVARFGADHGSACRTLLDSIAAARIEGLVVGQTNAGRPFVRLDFPRRGSIKVLQVASGKPALRDAIKTNTRAAKDRLVMKALNEFRKTLLNVGSAIAGTNGRVYVPVKVLANDPTPLTGALKTLRETLRSH